MQGYAATRTRMGIDICNVRRAIVTACARQEYDFRVRRGRILSIATRIFFQLHVVNETTDLRVITNSTNGHIVGQRYVNHTFDTVVRITVCLDGGTRGHLAAKGGRVRLVGDDSHHAADGVGAVLGTLGTA